MRFSIFRAWWILVLVLGVFGSEALHTHTSVRPVAEEDSSTEERDEQTVKTSTSKRDRARKKQAARTFGRALIVVASPLNNDRFATSIQSWRRRFLLPGPSYRTLQVYRI
jgi:hypothetical protein